MLVRRIAPADALLLREVRLRALATDPLAFGSTYAIEAPRNPSAWETWAREHASGTDKATFLALRDDTVDAVGLAMGRRMEEPRHFGLFSMWVDGGERRRGTGRELVEAVATWVRASGGTHLALWVTQPGARLFYERCGFVDDGRREPLAHAPDVIQIWMTREL
jgi:GNAT superfamily N-acetyltransferase